MAQCANLQWSDEFQKFNNKNWEVMTGDGCEYDICGWGNNELEIYSKDNILIENNQLIIEARKDIDKNGVAKYSSGRIRSLNKFDMEYGVLEARIRIPQGQVRIYNWL